MQRVLLIGDSVTVAPSYSFGSGGYAPLVADRLAPAGIEVIWWPKSGGTVRLLESLATGIAPLDVDLIHFSAGLHDLAVYDPPRPTGVDVPTYAANLRVIVDGLRERSPAQLVWAATTPVIDERHQRVKNCVRREADVQRYNGAAMDVMRASAVPIDDLHAVLAASNLQETLGPDGVHPSVAGRALLADAVATCLATMLRPAITAGR